MTQRRWSRRETSLKVTHKEIMTAQLKLLVAALDIQCSGGNEMWEVLHKHLVLQKLSLFMTCTTKTAKNNCRAGQKPLSWKWSAGQRLALRLWRAGYNPPSRVWATRLRLLSRPHATTRKASPNFTIYRSEYQVNKRTCIQLCQTIINPLKLQKLAPVPQDSKTRQNHEPKKAVQWAEAESGPSTPRMYVLISP